MKYDAEKAKSLLDEAGWKEGADGIREKNGKKQALAAARALNAAAPTPFSWRTVS